MEPTAFPSFGQILLFDELRHVKELVDVIKIGEHVFAQQVSDRGGDPTALRIRY